MISEPEARASLYHSLTAQNFNRAQFDLYLDTYLRQRAGVSLAAREWTPAPEDQTDAVRVDQLSVSSALGDAASNPELSAFVAVMAADYVKARELIKAMVPTDRAVLIFWLEETQSLVTDVQITENRF